ncbi:MAG: UDP-N-acetylglucosamine--N-acetylmuramyl-(pentapeptide) pyrophosphoryl-undecaprenol N-acetylglucosamine transferase [Minisyncoccia bacterium]
MKILFTGGGSGGHFYPIIAVAEEINNIVREEKLLPAELFFMSDSPYDKNALAKENIKFINSPAGKLRRYFSWLNFIDVFRTAWGTILSTFKLFIIFPDVVFSKGAYSSFPVVMAARFLGIPIVIHESDSVPGRSNIITGRFAKKIAVSYPEAAEYFKMEKIAVTGNPLRSQIMRTRGTGAYEFLKLEESFPTILVLGGSLGAEVINNIILEALPDLVNKYQVIHQTGKKNITEITNTARVILGDSPLVNRYRPFDYLNDLSLTMSAGISSLIISRAGSTIFEIANWGIPSIIIPITDSNGDHQRKNAYSYASTGACTVIEENNLSSAVLVAEIDRLMNNEKARNDMTMAAKGFARPEAAKNVAREILRIGLSHEK